MRCHLFLQGLDDRLGGVVLQEEVEVGFVIVYQAAKGRNVHLSQVRVHNIVHWQIEYLF
jgi:hypothetical protein